MLPQPSRSTASAIRRLTQRMVGEPEIVVGREVDTLWRAQTPEQLLLLRACSCVPILAPEAEALSSQRAGRLRRRLQPHAQPVEQVAIGTLLQDSASSAAGHQGRSSSRRPGSTRVWASSDSPRRPALRRTYDAGIRRRAVAIMRTSSSGSSGGRSPSGVPSTRDQQVDRHALGVRIERWPARAAAVAVAAISRPCR